MGVEVEVPDFDWSGFYYPQILERLMQFKRTNVPELTDESAFEPFVQLIRMMSIVGHLNNVLLDIQANENTLPTAKLAETVRNMLRLIAYEMRPATPAQVDIVAELAKVFLSPFSVISAGAQVATQRDGDQPIIYFEMLSGYTIANPTNVLGFCYSDESGVFTDRTAAINSALVGDDFTPWVTAAMKDAIYFGHADVMWNKLNLTVPTPSANIVGIWEFYDGNFRKSAPTSVTVNGGNLDIVLTAWLGTQNRQGTKLRVEFNDSTAFQDVESTWNGVANVCTVTGYLGQTSPTTDPTRYTVGSDWSELNTTGDDFEATGDVSYDVPQSQTQNWRTGEVNGSTAFWLRFRIITVSSPTSPVVRLARIDTGKQYVTTLATQGRTATDSPLGSSTGLPGQTFDTSRENFVLSSETVKVDSVVWARVTNFLDSGPLDKHYVVRLGANDKATIVFGDGVNGRIPPIGVGNIAITYRYGANDNGNIGALKATVDKSGLTFVNQVYNPRQAAGWKVAQGATTASLEQAKIEGPASLRAREVALGPDDVVALTKSYEDATGARPFARALAIEEGFGPKTMMLVVVAAGGGLATNDQLTALDEYFNGDPYSNPPKPKRLVANQQLTSVNYTPHPIDVVATVIGDVVEEAIRNRLNEVLNPEAIKDDGVSFEWSFGEDVPKSRVEHEIFKTDDKKITDVQLTGGPFALSQRELPVLGTLALTINVP